MSEETSNWVLVPRAPRGLAAVSPELRKEIARKGGSAVPADKRAFAKNKTLAKEAGSKGGKSIKPEKRSFSTNRQLAAEAGRKGGMTKRKKAP